MNKAISEPSIVTFRGASLQSRALHATIRGTLKPFLRVWSRYPEARWPYGIVDHAGRLLSVRPGTTHRTVHLAHTTATLTTPANARADRLVVHLHGGAFLIGGRHLHRNLLARLAADLAAPVLSVHYRQMPRHGMADSIADCVDSYRYALGLGIAPEGIVLFGDSAGATLTFGTAVAVRDAGLPLPAALIAISPLTDFDPAAKLAAAGSETCALFPREIVEPIAALIQKLNGGTLPTSPVDLDLTGLPPTLIQVGSTELLYPDAVAMANKLAAQRVPTELQVWERQVHVFHAAGALPEARRALREICAFAERAMGAPASAKTA